MTGKHTVRGAEITLPNAKLITAVASNGYVAFAYLNVDAAGSRNDCAGVSNLEECLSKKVTNVSKKAVELGMSRENALIKMILHRIHFE